MLDPVGFSIFSCPLEPLEMYISTGANVSPLTACELRTKNTNANKNVSATPLMLVTPCKRVKY